MKRKLSLRWPVLAALGLLFLLSAYQVGSQLLRAQAEDDAFSALSDAVSSHKAQEAPEAPSAEASASPYQFLKEQNPDFWGWLSIPETELDYPVMYTPEEPEYYLRRAFDGSGSHSGVPFVGQGYREDGRHTIIYGHNMKNGTMFATLLSYADRAFWQAHPAITLDTLDGSRTYQVLGAFYSKAFLQTEEDVFRFYQCSDLSARDAFESYVAQVRAAALYDTGVAAEYGGELLTLATCSYHAQNGRFVVVGYWPGPLDADEDAPAVTAPAAPGAPGPAQPAPDTSGSAAGTRPLITACPPALPRPGAAREITAGKRVVYENSGVYVNSGHLTTTKPAAPTPSPDSERSSINPETPSTNPETPGISGNIFYGDNWTEQDQRE